MDNSYENQNQKTSRTDQVLPIEDIPKQKIQAIAILLYACASELTKNMYCQHMR